MKIGILGAKGIPGRHGVEVVLDALAPELVALGHQVTVYGYESYTQQMEYYLGARVRTVRGLSGKNMEMISHMWNACLDANREKFDVLHIHSTDPCLLAWLPRPARGMVATSHGQAYRRRKWSVAARVMSRIAEAFYAYIPDVITSVSKPLSSYYRETYRREVHYIPNGIRIRRPPADSLLSRWGLNSGEFLFCSAGRMERTKGVHTLLEAYGELEPGIPLIIAGGGSGSDRGYFEALKRSRPPGVEFVGFLTGDELYALYAHAGVFVFPSEYEAMSMALLEGLSFGTPTVYSDIAENRAVADGLGRSFAVGDSKALAREILFVLAHSEEARAMGERARKQIASNHDWSAIARQYDAIYRAL